MPSPKGPTGQKEERKQGEQVGGDLISSAEVAVETAVLAEKGRGLLLRCGYRGKMVLVAHTPFSWVIWEAGSHAATSVGEITDSCCLSRMGRHVAHPPADGEWPLLWWLCRLTMLCTTQRVGGRFPELNIRGQRKPDSIAAHLYLHRG